MRGLIHRAAVVAAGAGLLAAGMAAAQAAGASAVVTVAGIKATLPANAGSNPQVDLKSVSCASAGNCTAVGLYTDSGGNVQGLLLTETAGSWAAGVEATPPSGAGSDPIVDPTSVSCASAGNCTAVGDYADSSGNPQGLLLTETAGSWAAGVEATLPADAGSGADVSLPSVSCTSAGNCTAVGQYLAVDTGVQGLLLTQTGGGWAAGVEAPLPAGVSGTGLNSVSCASAGNCTAVGGGVLLTQTAGNWTATEAPLPTGAGSGSADFLTSVSCASAGNCTAVGLYTDSGGNVQGVLLTQTAGNWTATEAPLPTGAGSNPNVDATSVSCASAGNCTAVGDYADSAGQQGLLLTQTAGSWAATKAPLPTGAGSNPDVFLGSVSCASAGNCTAVGHYADSAGGYHGLLLTQTAANWKATKAPLPSGAGSDPNVDATSVSCASAGNCTAAGRYADSAGNTQGLLLTQAPAGTADLSLTNSGAPNPVQLGHALTYTVTVTSTGGQAADNVKVTDPLPSTVRFGSMHTTSGSCRRTTGGSVTCQIPQLAATATATITIVVRPEQAGTLHDTATVTAVGVTPDADDSATATSTVG